MSSFSLHRIVRSDRGFTLVELLTTMTVIGILSAIATAQFHEYSKRAFDSRAESDLRKIIIAEEAYFTDHERYVACNGLECELQLDGVLLSLNTEIQVETSDGDTAFTVEAFHPRGERLFEFDSSDKRYRSSPRS